SRGSGRGVPTESCDGAAESGSIGTHPQELFRVWWTKRVLGDFKGMNTREKARVFVVAGASGAIGSEIVRALAREEGARIYAGYSSNQAAINELVELGGA